MAMCLSRSDAWSRVRIPQEEYGRTKINPLRALDHQKLQQLYVQMEWDALWDFAEQCFMQPAGPFDVKLQFYIIKALEHVNKPDVLLWAISFFSTWKQAYPELLVLHFNDGTPFCDEACHEWISTLNKENFDNRSRIVEKIKCKIRSRIKQEKYNDRYFSK